MMKATGITRRVDDLGRVVIPKEIRKNSHIREGDALEIFVDDGAVIFKKCSPIGKFGDFATEYADALHESTGHIALIADRDTVIAVAGAPKKEYLNKPIGPVLELTIQEMKVMIATEGEERGSVVEGDQTKYNHIVAAPIISEGDPVGVVALCSQNPADAQKIMGEVKLVETAARFLGKLPE